MSKPESNLQVNLPNKDAFTEQGCHGLGVQSCFREIVQLGSRDRKHGLAPPGNLAEMLVSWRLEQTIQPKGTQQPMPGRRVARWEWSDR
jgi:hypothetical protein